MASNASKNSTTTATGAGNPSTGGNTSGAGNGDALDKAVDFVEKKAGHPMSHSMTEKISDGVRKGFAKLTGKDIPIKDKDYR